MYKALAIAGFSSLATVAQASSISFGTDPSNDGLVDYDPSTGQVNISGTVFANPGSGLDLLSGGFFSLSAAVTNLRDNPSDTGTSDLDHEFPEIFYPDEIDPDGSLGFGWVDLVSTGASVDWSITGLVGGSVETLLYGSIVDELLFSFFAQTPSSDGGSIAGNLSIDGGYYAGSGMPGFLSASLTFDPFLLDNDPATPFQPFSVAFGGWQASTNGTIGSDGEPIIIDDGSGVPEPMTWALIALGLAALVGVRDRLVRG